MTDILLDTLKDSYKDCKLCNLCEARTQVVFPHGSSKATVFFVGEAPGADEDRIGKPFQGKAGKKLDKMLEFVGLKREDVWISNSNLCRPPNNRPPTEAELNACRPRLLEEIDLIKPKLIVALGKTAIHQLHGETVKESIEKLNNQGWTPVEIKGHQYPVLRTYHPSYILRSPEVGYEKALPHWEKLKEWLDERI